MKRLKLFVAAVILLSAASVSCAEEKFDPAARAKVIAPFIDEQTTAVVHVDFSRINIDSLLELAAQYFPEDEVHFIEAKQQAPRAIDSFLKAGGKDIYFVVQASITSKPKLIIPINPQADQQAFMENELFKDMPLKRNGDVLVVSPPTPASSDKTVPDQRPELAKAFETAGDTAVQVLLLPPKYFRRVIEETMPQLPEQIGGGPSTVLTQGCLWAALGADLSPQPTVRVVIQSQNPEAADAFGKKLSEILQNFAKMPFVQETAPYFSKATAILTPNIEGDKLVLVLNQQKKDISIVVDSLKPILEKARDEARRVASSNNLKQIGLAMHNYHDANKYLPAAASYSPDGKPLLSWRVMILPMIEQQKLYDQFHLDEPWDSPNNRKLIDKMPPEFRSPKSKLKEPGRSNYVVPVGPGTMFEGREGINMSSVKDGTAHTILAVEVDDAHAVIWTKPEDMPYDPKEPAKGLGGLYKNVFCALFVDGAVRIIKLPCPVDKLRAAFSAAAEDPTPDF